MSPSAPLIDRLALAIGSGILLGARAWTRARHLAPSAARAALAFAGTAASNCVGFTNQNTCVLVGHDWYWPYEGDQPICARCNLTVDQAETVVA